MYAVIATGGKQYRVAEGDVIQVERLAVDVGNEIEFDKVLMVGAGEDVTVGAPYIDGGKVSATVRNHGRGEKIVIIKMRRRKHHRKQMGHRQDYTEVQIGAIKG
ncbi:50S ribosomal protein L21 [Acidihalobacter yilgarnensis]|uniref:Large ribosomal subunit protein bL21 n=1 Tax=Acidihalobacter yilgarnensis TaxID=2819280 RepID=A0A1D8ISF8_9GAMM|nr:50S ribosomal protein L21 [Acidihalobacter yilgarnensis]AOU99343.1 50S ribosomal protein L21 [Acidihalobacter yilgarnensis]